MYRTNPSRVCRECPTSTQGRRKDPTMMYDHRDPRTLVGVKVPKTSVTESLLKEVTEVGVSNWPVTGWPQRDLVRNLRPTSIGKVYRERGIHPNRGSPVTVPSDEHRRFQHRARPVWIRYQPLRFLVKFYTPQIWVPPKPVVYGLQSVRRTWVRNSGKTGLAGLWDYDTTLPVITNRGFTEVPIRG